MKSAYRERQQSFVEHNGDFGRGLSHYCEMVSNLTHRKRRNSKTVTLSGALFCGHRHHGKPTAIFNEKFSGRLNFIGPPISRDRSKREPNAQALTDPALAAGEGRKTQ
jgi:hypothetical protein